MAVFPKLYLVAGSERNDLNPALQTAIIVDDYVVVTNGHILIYSKKEAFYHIGNDSLRNLEVGRSIHYDTLKAMSASTVKEIIFTEETITLIHKGSKEDTVHYYDGYEIPNADGMQGHTFASIGHKGQVVRDKNGKPFTNRYPNWKAVLPTFEEGEANDKFGRFGIDAGLLDTVAQCFSQSLKNKEKRLKLDFSVNRKMHEKLDFPMSAIQVRPLLEYDFGECAIIMPVAYGDVPLK